jgi:hypothetical protein
MRMSRRTMGAPSKIARQPGAGRGPLTFGRFAPFVCGSEREADAAFDRGTEPAAVSRDFHPCGCPGGPWGLPRKSPGQPRPGWRATPSRGSGKHGWDAAAAQGRRETRSGRAPRFSSMRMSRRTMGAPSKIARQPGAGRGPLTFGRFAPFVCGSERAADAASVRGTEPAAGRPEMAASNRGRGGMQPSQSAGGSRSCGCGSARAGARGIRGAMGNPRERGRGAGFSGERGCCRLAAGLGPEARKQRRRFRRKLCPDFSANGFVGHDAPRLTVGPRCEGRSPQQLSETQAASRAKTEAAFAGEERIVQPGAGGVI